MTSLEDISGLSCCGRNGDGVEFLLQSCRQLCTQLTQPPACLKIQHLPLLFGLAYCKYPVIKESTLGTPSQGTAAPEDGSTAGPSPAHSHGLHQGERSAQLTDGFCLSYGFTFGHGSGVSLCLATSSSYACGDMRCNKQMVAAASEELILIISASCSSR